MVKKRSKRRDQIVENAGPGRIQHLRKLTGQMAVKNMSHTPQDRGKRMDEAHRISASTKCAVGERKEAGGKAGWHAPHASGVWPVFDPCWKLFDQ